MGRLIIDDTTIYEIDEECLRQKKRMERAEDFTKSKNRSDRSDRFDKNPLKERPAP